MHPFHIYYKECKSSLSHGPLDSLAVAMVWWGHLLRTPDGGQLTRLKFSPPRRSSYSQARRGQKTLPAKGQKLEEKLTLPCGGPQAFLQAQRPLGRPGLVGLAGI